MLDKVTKPGEKRSRRAIIDSLKVDGPQDAARLAERLGISAMAVRQHLYDLEAEGLVNHEAEARPPGTARGRPAKLWALTAAADRFFPDGHAEFSVGLINSMKEVFGAKGLDKLLAVRARDQVAAYKARMGARRSLPAQLRALAEIRTEEGYMAEVENVAGGYLLVENHCPVCSAAAACTGLCNMELEVFQKSLGSEVEVKRIDHILAGARRCAYLVTRKR
ncbi:metalloregulator ArsR/SmtB family transcription factor [Pelagibius sp.]|uniref:helix-turn-helix transcriptional regulator n=1 Tax=Pelagibius sp. TaxID=1931238 RepID=UPI002639B156|nr:metalloregulator ArsR/SmtB family transcription factor [Pelagibius sp.]